MLNWRVIPVAAAGLVMAATLATPAAAATSGKIPSGAYSRLVADILRAQTLTTGQGVTVAVVSTGVDPHDAGLSGKVKTGPDYAFKPTVPLADEYGTCAASIIAARGPSGSQPLTALGIAPDARILSIRAFPQPKETGASSYFTNADVSQLNARAIEYAVAHGAQVIYLQTDSDALPAPELSSAIQLAVTKKVVIVAAAFGDNTDPTAPEFPPAMPGVVGVGSIRTSGGLTPYDKAASGRNNGIFISGPGNTFYDSSGYGIDGPGAAAAVVAGTMALVKSLYPGITVPQAELALARSARYHPHGGYDTTTGFGLVDPYAALQQAATLVKSPNAASAGVALSARPVAGQVPGTINAVHHSWAKLLGGAAAGAVGVLLIVAAVVVFRTGRRRTRGRRGSHGRRHAGAAW